MIKCEKWEVMNMDNAVRGSRNPLNSWHNSDSYYDYDEGEVFIIGENDMKLLQNLCKAGSDERKFLRQIFVSVDIAAPLYWWKEYSTYKVGTTENSCSTMHCIHKKEFTIEDFSFDKLEGGETVSEYTKATINLLNVLRNLYLKTKDKVYWYSMIQLLPSSYNQMRTCTLNYEVLRNMYHARKHHKLDEWVEFCSWIENLPYAKELIIGGEN